MVPVYPFGIFVVAFGPIAIKARCLPQFQNFESFGRYKFDILQTSCFPPRSFLVGQEVVWR